MNRDEEVGKEPSEGGNAYTLLRAKELSTQMRKNDKSSVKYNKTDQRTC